jgi:aminopeptidase-like protein
LNEIGQNMHEFMAELYPMCRSITGEGVRQTLLAIRQHIPLAINEIPSGTKVFDWMVPREWNIRDAYVKNSKGERIIDFKESNLHVLSYSIPVHLKMALDELKEHLYTIPECPDWIPHKTSYYSDNWGFSLAHRKLLHLPNDEYEVVIDSSLENGSLTIGECLLPGTTSDEVLISCHVCHPSLCNDNLSGIALSTYLAEYLANAKRRLSYRFLFIPSTIGAITWLALNEQGLGKIKHGFVVRCVGDSGHPTYKKSRRGNADIDQAFSHVFKHYGSEYEIQDFVPFGSDERQYSAPGINLPIGCYMRTPSYPEYHTSADNLEFVKPEAMADSFSICQQVIAILETNQAYLNCNPKCEPQLGKRDLFRNVGGRPEGQSLEFTYLWILNYSDGLHTLMDIADLSGLDYKSIREAADRLLDKGLLTEPDAIQRKEQTAISNTKMEI